MLEVVEQQGVLIEKDIEASSNETPCFRLLASETDEGTAAHIFQLLMVAQVPVVGFFIVKWLPRAPGPTLPVLALQAGAALAAIAAVVVLT